MSNSECRLKLLDLYFSKFDFSMTRNNDGNEYNTAFNVEYAKKGNDESQVKITVNTSLSNATKTVLLNLQTIALFEIDKEGIEDTVADQLIKLNTVAIIFPFIRSQISLLTTQPGMTPIILPPININALMESQEQTEDKE